ncbi:MAG: tetratricopeptide repeat protein, partial [Anaerolineaceae bacterium]|nr:tetratricopeptide repeat protein [Anaerolineaceae bacterium]
PQENSATQYPTATPKPTRTQPIPTQTPISSPTATIQPTQIPGKVILSSPAYEKEDLNNCGPATLSMYLKHFGWVGDQFTISDRIKPIRADRNVNIEELASYVMTDIGYLQVEYRVGGNLDVLKKIIASGIPVMIEGSFKLQKSFWPNDDRWAGHYVLLTGYDDAEKIFITQDSELGPDQRVPYDQLFEEWESFNRVYMMLFPPEQAPVYQTLLGDDWDRDLNRKRAIDIFQAETKADPKNAFAFFNLGTNLVYFDRYGEAFNAYDTALKLKLPQRMLRYQFGVYMTYFNTGRIDELIALCDYALEITPNSEEAMLWKGWGLYRQGRSDEALKIFQKALEARPDYSDANYAINFVLNN